MDQPQQLLAIILAACVGMLAILAILRRGRRAMEPPSDSPFATATEGETLCPQCGMGNLFTGDRCIRRERDSVGSRGPRRVGGGRWAAMSVR
jgi:hypothetical protein